MSRVWVRTGIDLSVSQKYPHLSQEPRDLVIITNKERPREMAWWVRALVVL